MPMSGPKPVTMLMTPGGKPACSITFTNSRIDAEAYVSDGLMTMVQPAASVGAIFHAVSSSEFHGTIAATTPIGSWRV